MIYALPERALASFSIVGAKGYDTNLRSKGITTSEWLRFDALLQRLHDFTLEILSAVFFGSWAIPKFGRYSWPFHGSLATTFTLHLHIYVFAAFNQVPFRSNILA